jgi:hypothetical protein
MKELTEEQIEYLKEIGCYSPSQLASILSDFYGYDELFGDWPISDVIEAVQNEISKLRKK